jgi:hypothetical protein
MVSLKIPVRFSDMINIYLSGIGGGAQLCIRIGSTGGLERYLFSYLLGILVAISSATPLDPCEDVVRLSSLAAPYWSLSCFIAYDFCLAPCAPCVFHFRRQIIPFATVSNFAGYFFIGSYK